MDFERIKLNLSSEKPVALGIQKEGNNILEHSIIEFLRNLWKVPMVIDASKIKTHYSFLKDVNNWGLSFQSIIIHNLYEIDGESIQILKKLLDKNRNPSVFIIYEPDHHLNNQSFIRSILDRIHTI